MKHISIVLALFMLIGCDHQEKQILQQELVNLRAENDTLKHSKEVMQRHIVGITSLIDEVDDALDSIAQASTKVEQISEFGELGISIDAYTQSQTVNDNIAEIERYIVDTQERVAQLEQQVLVAGQEFRNFRNIATKLRSRLEEREFEVNILKERVSQLTTQIDTLEFTIKQQERQVVERDNIIARQADRLNQAYYIVGTKKHLTALGIVRTTKGLLIAGRKTLLREGFPTHVFIKDDVSNLREIQIPAKKSKVRIMTHQITESYYLVANGSTTTLHIHEPDRFWDSGRYLVVMID